MAVADIVARQVEAFNAHDLESYLACYADHVVVTSGTGEVLLEGIAAVGAQYAEHATAQSLDVEALVAYHVRDDRIDRVMVMTAEPEA